MQSKYSITMCKKTIIGRARKFCTVFSFHNSTILLITADIKAWSNEDESR